tara:strand:- start:3375 stop:3713 length:339 start_codon:yes stop_codon:yes gene_type:complete
MFLKSSITALSLVVLAGCASNQTATTDYKLCYKLATTPSYNLNGDARRAEVKSRGLDCRVYSDRIDKEERELKLEAAGATQINNRTTIYQPIKREEQDICGINKYGVYIYCN